MNHKKQKEVHATGKSADELWSFPTSGEGNVPARFLNTSGY